MRGPHSPALMRAVAAPKGGAHANSPLNSPIMQVSPRSPRPHMSGGGRPSRERQKKRNDAAAAERVFGQLAMANNNNNNNSNSTPPSEGRRYVDTSHSPVDSAKRSHRRAVSLSLRAELDQPAGANNGGSGANGGGIGGIGGSGGPTVIDMRHRPARRLHSTMRPSQTYASSGVFGGGSGGSGGGGGQGSAHPVNAVVARRKAERFLSGKLVDFNERLGHRRANSWDPRDEADELARRRKSEMTTLEVALATKKAELAAKEKMLLERQSRQEAELMSLAGATNMEKELQELLRLQRKLKTSPERHAAVLAPPVATPPPPALPAESEEDEDYNRELERDDAALMQTLNDLNQELQTLKKRTLRIENRVKELRCPGPTPLEMMTGGATFSQQQLMHPGPSSTSEGNFSASLPQHARRVEARRSPVTVATPERAKAQSPEQGSGSVPSFAKQPSFNSAFVPVGK